MNLKRYFPNVVLDCYKDGKGVYKDSNKVALNNGSNSGYTRFEEGEATAEAISTLEGIYSYSRPMVFVGCVPKGNPVQVEKAAISSITSANNVVTGWTTSKDIIADSEGLDVSKFKNCALVLVRFEKVDTAIYDPDCTINLCSC